LADQEIPATELPTKVAELLGGRAKNDRVLFLAADDSLNYEAVLRIVDLAKSGVRDLSIGVITME
jgi:biopolymer transport protein ExbD